MSEKEIIFIVEESVEGSFETKALGHGIYTQADSKDELKRQVQDAVRCHFESMDQPKVIRLHWIKEEVIPA